MKIDHNTFTGLFCLLAITITGFVLGSGVGLTAAELLSTKLFNAAIPLSLTLCFIYFLRGTKFDVLEEIFERQNISCAIFLYGIMEIFIKAFSRG